MNSISNLSDISFIVQGPLHRKLYPTISLNIRRLFPGAEIVVSTYTGTDVNGLDYDKCVFIEDPGATPYCSKINAKLNNVNRQILTTINGLNTATRTYAFKLRSDFILNGVGFLSWYDQCPKADLKYKVFSHKVLSCSYFARNPRSKKQPLPFHPSDLIFFGLRSDLINLFNIPLMPNEEINYFVYKKSTYCRYVPEQYIWINCLRKNDKSISCKHQLHCDNAIIEDTERYAVSNFIYLDYNQFNVMPPKRLRSFSENNFRNIITNIELQKLYVLYVDNSHEVPQVDATRLLIDRKVKILRIYSFFTKLIVYFIPNKSLKASIKKSILIKLAKNLYI